MEVLIAGGFGYLGAHIAQRFAERGDAVTILGHRTHQDAAEWASSFRVVVADVTDVAQTAGVCDGMDLVVQAAALDARSSAADPASAVRVTGLGTRNVLDAAASAGVRSFIYLSTFHVYGPIRTDVLSEECPTFPVTPYASTHLLAEGFCYEYALRGAPVTVLRVSNGYGAPMIPSETCWVLAANDFCRSAVRDGVILLRSHGTQERDFVAVTDIVRAVELFADGPRDDTFPRAYNVGSGRSVTILGLARTVAEVWHEMSGSDVEVRVEAAGEPEPTRPFRYDIGRIGEIGFCPEADMRHEIRVLLESVGGE